MAPTEEWRPIPGYAKYDVSNLGRVRSFWRGAPRVLKPGSNRGGYRVARLYRAGGGSDSRAVHGLVASAFIGPRPAGSEIRHLDGVPYNNALSNLCYGSRSENTLDAVRHGTHPQARKTHCRHGHAFTAENTHWADRRRRCRTCMRAWGGRVVSANSVAVA